VGAAAPERIVEPDRFEVVEAEGLLRATLSSAIAVCIHDTLEEVGALLHLRFVVRADRSGDVTDTTLATELLLLDRCLQSLREVAPAARNLRARTIAHLPAAAPRAGCDAVLELIGQFLRDQGAEVHAPDLAQSAPRQVAFRPCMGSLKVG
jgi:chemotaxis receptor (MCP) glutamine deamidase CheD